MSFCLLHACTVYVCFLAQTRKIVRDFLQKTRPAGISGSSESSVLSRLVVHIPLMSLFICRAESFHTAEKKNLFSQRCPHWHLQILMVNNLISAACQWRQPGMWDALHCTWSHITPPMVQPLVAWGCIKEPVPCLHLLCEGAWARVRVCGPCACIHFLPVCFAPSTLPQIPHPNHNYNVISRIRQCPRCCFTLSFSPILWISNAVTLSSKSCTARSQTGVWHVCFYRLGWGRGLFDSTFLQFLTVQTRKRGLTIARVC